MTALFYATIVLIVELPSYYKHFHDAPETVITAWSFDADML